MNGRWAIRNHDGFGTLGYDLGIFDHGVWLLSRLKSPFVTVMGRHLLLGPHARCSPSRLPGPPQRSARP